MRSDCASAGPSASSHHIMARFSSGSFSALHRPRFHSISISLALFSWISSLERPRPWPEDNSNGAT